MLVTTAPGSTMENGVAPQVHFVREKEACGKAEQESRALCAGLKELSQGK